MATSPTTLTLALVQMPTLNVMVSMPPPSSHDIAENNADDIRPNILFSFRNARTLCHHYYLITV